jgi:hypothetical protein
MSKYYYRVSHSADTTETGCFQRRTYVQCEWGGHNAHRNVELVLSGWCEERFGSRVAFVQGVAPVAGWSFQEIDEQQWRESQPIKWGGRPTKTVRLALRLGSKKGSETPFELLWEQDHRDKLITDDCIICPGCGRVIEKEAQENG